MKNPSLTIHSITLPSIVGVGDTDLGLLSLGDLGRLNERRYSESLGYFLMRAGAIGLLAEAPNADTIRELRVSRVATYVVAESMLQFTK